MEIQTTRKELPVRVKADDQVVVVTITITVQSIQQPDLERTGNSNETATSCGDPGSQGVFCCVGNTIIWEISSTDGSANFSSFNYVSGDYVVSFSNFSSGSTQYSTIAEYAGCEVYSIDFNLDGVSDPISPFTLDPFISCN